MAYVSLRAPAMSSRSSVVVAGRTMSAWRAIAVQYGSCTTIVSGRRERPAQAVEVLVVVERVAAAPSGRAATCGYVRRSPSKSNGSPGCSSMSAIRATGMDARVASIVARQRRHARPRGCRRRRRPSSRSRGRSRRRAARSGRAARRARWPPTRAARRARARCSDQVVVTIVRPRRHAPGEVAHGRRGRRRRSPLGPLRRLAARRQRRRGSASVAGAVAVEERAVVQVLGDEHVAEREHDRRVRRRAAGGCARAAGRRGRRRAAG